MQSAFSLEIVDECDLQELEGFKLQLSRDILRSDIHRRLTD